MKRLTAASAALLVLGTSGCGDADGNADGKAADKPERRTAPVAVDDPDVACGGPAFKASAMDGGVEGLAERDEVAAALEDLVKEAGIDAPTALQGKDIDDAQWFVLGGTATALAVATGPWSADGPAEGAHYVTLEKDGDGWAFAGWGTCKLRPVPPAGLDWAEVSKARATLSTSTVAVWVNEIECTGGREPGTFLREPAVVETAKAVTLYWTTTPPGGNQECPGNPPVERIIELDEPLGDRVLLDGSVWPPRPVAARS